jgi:hypothetical protein
MILGTVVWLAWHRRWIPRPLVVATVASLLVLQIGPTLFRVREDRYRQDFLPVLDYIRPAVARGDILISQAEFSIPLGFRDNVVTDPSYGTRRSGRRTRQARGTEVVSFHLTTSDFARPAIRGTDREHR